LLSVTGNVDPDSVRAVAEERLASLAPGEPDPQPVRPAGTSRADYQSKHVEQVHFCIGTDGCSVYDDEIYTLAVLDSALGGSMSSRLFQEIREKRGLVYAIGSYTQSYGAGGAYTVYGGTSPDTWPQVQELVRAEFDKIMESGLAPDELERTQRNITGSLVLGLEGMSARMMRNARNELVFGREIPVEETMEKIRAVTNDGFTALARRMLDENLVSTTAIGP
jgi:predicted Zn-dependent peptidase